MSTTYAIFRKGLIPPEDPENGWYPGDLDEGWDYMEIGKTHGFLGSATAIVSYLPDDTPIYATDNGTKLKTLGELKKYYET